MTSLRRALAGIGALAVVVGAAVVALIISGYYELRWVSVALAVLGGFGFVGAGLYAWSRRPDRKIGALMTLIGFAWFAAMCVAADDALVFSLAVLTGNIFAAALMHLLLAYPDGELHTRGDRITVWLAYVLVTVGSWLLYTLDDPISNCPECPPFVLDVAGLDAVESIGIPALNMLGVIILTRVLVTIGRRWRASARPAGGCSDRSTGPER